ncbi:DUF4318 domain-containing protein [Paenibacillus albiflavus]|uniref:DUF4318 domain-containing protein n=1 Tax=Paenibacillus albiflavus TaxID=2545760 RepID=A0A4R4ELH5_9BACL|nr:DUF4318 domain-containing protein [Paenibacillus albiflavus]TCZ80859.1 DUF4318 domain-containing protein [Paenibacillus albiflavus]
MTIRRRLFNRFFKKGFHIEIDDALTYPSKQTICQAIEQYAAENKKQVQFVSSVQPLTFLYESRQYYVDIRMSRGGYTIFCREV